MCWAVCNYVGGKHSDCYGRDKEEKSMLFHHGTVYMYVDFRVTYAHFFVEYFVLCAFDFMYVCNISLPFPLIR
jgi:hypothetical protein